MDGREYKSRMKALRSEMERLSAEFYAPIIEEFKQAIKESPFREGRWQRSGGVNVSALARKHGADQAGLQKRLAKLPEFQLAIHRYVDQPEIGA